MREGWQAHSRQQLACQAKFNFVEMASEGARRAATYECGSIE
jgi:hypothetical protein